MIEFLNPTCFTAHLGLTCATQQRYIESLAPLKNAATVSSNRPFVLAALVRVQAMEENEEAARDILASLETAAENYISAKIHLGLGGHDKVFEWLQKGVAKHVVRMPS